MTTPRCPKYTLLPITVYITLQISNFKNNSAGKIFSIYQDDRCSQQLQLFRDWLVAALFAALLMWTPLKEVSQSLDNWEIAKWPQSSLVTYLVHCSGAVCTCLWWVATNQCSSNQGGLHVPLLSRQCCICCYPVGWVHQCGSSVRKFHATLQGSRAEFHTRVKTDNRSKSSVSPSSFIFSFSQIYAFITHIFLFMVCLNMWSFIIEHWVW